MFRRSRRLSAVVALLGCVALVARAAPPTQLGGETPQAVVERLTRAAERKDFAEMMACIDPASRTEATAGLLMASTMMVAFMGMGAGLAGEMAEGMAEAFAGEEGVKPEDQAKMEKQKAEAAAKTAELTASYSALLKKHGLPDLAAPDAPSPEGSPEELLKGVDQVALAADLLAFMDKLGEEKKGDEKAGEPQELGPPVPRDVTDYKIEGDRATAKAGDETVEFVKVDGRWFFKPPADKGDEK